MMKFTGILAAAGMLLALAGTADAQEKKDITLGVGGKPLLYYLPLTIAEQKGFFKEEGLNVSINDFGGGAKSLQSLIGGSVDVVTGAYEHTIRMQQKGQEIQAVVELGQFPGIVLAVRKDLAGQGQVSRRLQGPEDRRHSTRFVHGAGGAVRAGEERSCADRRGD